MDPAGFVRGPMKMHKDEFDLKAKGITYSKNKKNKNLFSLVTQAKLQRLPNCTELR